MSFAAVKWSDTPSNCQNWEYVRLVVVVVAVGAFTLTVHSTRLFWHCLSIQFEVNLFCYLEQTKKKLPINDTRDTLNGVWCCAVVEMKWIGTTGMNNNNKKNNWGASESDPTVWPLLTVGSDELVICLPRCQEPPVVGLDELKGGRKRWWEREREREREASGQPEGVYNMHTSTTYYYCTALLVSRGEALCSCSGVESIGRC